jgi:hypothetical protein
MSFFSDLKDQALGFLTKDDGSFDFNKLAGLGLGGYGIYSLLQGSDDTANRPIGYTGGIPKYEYKRELLPNAFASTYTAPPTEEGGLPTVVPRRPGSGGRYYFTQQSGDSFVPVAPTTEMAGGGLASLAGSGQGYYLGGPTDGMADLVPATIDGNQPAALSDGEFVIPADVVSHLGNGNSEAGAQQLYSMMDRVRTERTGTTKQGPEINPIKMMPA